MSDGRLIRPIADEIATARPTPRIVLVAHDPDWLDDFERESASVAPAFGDLLVSLHHIGSTAILDIEAKPVIDMLAAVDDIGGVDAQNPKFEELGYEVMGEFGIPGRRYFRKDSASGERTHQIHAFQADSPEVDRHLAFRDFMRAHPRYARQYAALKRQLAEKYPNDMTAYTDGKSEFIKDMDARATAWRGK